MLRILIEYIFFIIFYFFCVCPQLVVKTKYIDTLINLLKLRFDHTKPCSSAVPQHFLDGEQLQFIADMNNQYDRLDDVCFSPDTFSSLPNLVFTFLTLTITDQPLFV